jgi:LuxR family transcriptional regulator of csgAB operon
LEDSLWPIWVHGVGQQALLMLEGNQDGLDQVWLQLQSERAFQADRLRIVLFNIDESRANRLISRGLLEAAHGVFFRDDSPDHMIQGINAILTGDRWITKKAIWRVMKSKANGQDHSGKTISPLTKRECEVLLAAAAGLTNKDVAEDLGISISTVRMHLYRSYKKLNVHNRFQATLWAATYL